MHVHDPQITQEDRQANLKAPSKQSSKSEFSSPDSVQLMKLQELADASSSVNQLQNLQMKADRFSNKNEYQFPVQRQIKVNPVKPDFSTINTPVVQRGIHNTFQKEGADGDEIAIAYALAGEIENILEAAVALVDSGEGETASSMAFYRDEGTRARGAKRGTAIHAESYDIIGTQLEGFGSIESSHGGGRADIKLTLPSGSIIIFDITSARQAEKAHTAGRGYEKVPGVIAVIEISYDDDKI